MLKSYICIDLETTGLNPKRDKIIEIGAIKVIDGEMKDKFESFVNPGRKLEERIVELTGIKDEQLKDAPSINEIWPALATFMEDLPLLGHSILFDYSFLKKAAVDRKEEFERTAVDTLRIARRYLADLEHRNLEFLCNYYQIPHKAHRAYEDALATHKLYECLVRDFSQNEEGLFEPTSLIYKVKRDTPSTPAQRERILKMIEQYHLEIDFDVDSLTRSEASRFIDKTLAACVK